MKIKSILLFILIIAAVLRFWQVGQTPIALDWDEVSLGYNAYSIMQTGKDEYGKFLPVVLESFGDFKPALYAYLIIPFIPLFDLSGVAVRLPAAIIGVLAVFLTYILTNELLKRKDIALVAAFLLAISPWHLQFSRVAFESSVGMAFNLAGIVFFLKGLKKPWLLSLSSIFFSLSIYTYQSEKLFVPLLLLILFAVYWKSIVALPKKYIIIAGLLLCIVSFPITHFTLTNQNGLARARGVSFLSDTNSLLQRNVKIYSRDKENNDLLGQIFDNRRLVYTKTVIQGYLSHFDLKWLFITGDATKRHHAPETALMYIVELPFLLIGLYLLLFSKIVPINKQTKLFIILWILATPIPASLTTGLPHAVRTLNVLPTLQIVTAIGLVGSYLILHKRYKIILATSYIILATCNFAFFLNQYFVQQNYYYADQWNYGYEELVKFISPRDSKYKKIIVSNQAYLDQSYMFFLFYQKYDPKKYLAEGGTRISGIERNGNGFKNYEFRRFNYYDEKDLPILFVGTHKDFQEEFIVIKRINFPDGKEAIRVVENE